jgi:hypothetical protein
MQYEYLWADGVKVKKPVKLTAPQYIDALFDWIEAQVWLEHCLSGLASGNSCGGTTSHVCFHVPLGELLLVIDGGSALLLPYRDI